MIAPYVSFTAFGHRMATFREVFPPLTDKQRGSGYVVRKLNRMLATQEVWVMPSKAAKTGKRSPSYDTTFVNFKLVGEAKDRFVHYMAATVEEHSKVLTGLMSQGMKFSFSENLEHGFFLASVTCKDEGSINNNRCITSRSNDWFEALMMCCFKIDELGVDEDWLDQAGSDEWG